jgi:hypothetical protein
MALTSSVQNINAPVVDSSRQGFFQALDEQYFRKIESYPGPAIPIGATRLVGAAFMALASGIEAGVCEIGAHAPLLSKIHKPCKREAARAGARVTAAMKHMGRGAVAVLGGGGVLKLFDEKNAALNVLIAKNEELAKTLKPLNDQIIALTAEVAAAKNARTALENLKSSSDVENVKLIQAKDAQIQELLLQIAKLNEESEKLKAQNVENAQLLNQPTIAKLVQQHRSKDVVAKPAA